MAISSINVSRVSHNMRTLSLLESLRANTMRLFAEQVRISSGNRLNAPSEDPVTSARAIQLTEVLEQQDQILANLRHADSFMATTDASISEVNDLLIQARSIASEMVNSTADQSQRDAMAELVTGIIDQLVTVGNRMYGNVYLFGGQQTLRVPFTQVHGGVEYRGDEAALKVQAARNQEQTINLTGAELFGALTGQVSGYVDLNPAITADTRLVDLGGTAGTGVRPTLMRVSLTVPNVSFLVDLSGADTAGNVVDAINAAAAAAGLVVGPGGDFQAGFNASRDGFQLTAAAGNVTVTEVGEGVTARDLGMLGTGAPVLVGRDVNTRLTPMTRIADLFGGAGAVLGAIRIDNGSLSATVDLAGAATVQELLNRINFAGVEVEARINPAATGIDIVSRMSGSDMHVGEAGGHTAGLLGIRSLHGGTALSRLNHGQGVSTVAGLDDLRFVARDGTLIDVNLDGARTMQDVIDLINARSAMAGFPPPITASLAVQGNGLRIVDNTGGGGTLQVQRLNFSAAIDDLGLSRAVTAGGGNELIGADPNGIRPESVFSALIDLHRALIMGGPQHLQEQAITAAAERIQGFIDQTTRLQGVVGARSQAMTTRLQMTEDAVLKTRELLSSVKDLDFTEAITKFQQAQTALQANLMTGPRLLQMTLLDFLR